eukprot:jgi/Tetstr1/448759/TSEL_035994.t1
MGLAARPNGVLVRPRSAAVPAGRRLCRHRPPPVSHRLSLAGLRRATVTAAAAGGSGRGSSGGGGGGGGGDGGGSEGSNGDGDARQPQHPPLLLLVAASSAGLCAVWAGAHPAGAATEAEEEADSLTLSTNQISEAVGALRRLQREAFQELVNVRQRLDTLEEPLHTSAAEGAGDFAKVKVTGAAGHGRWAARPARAGAHEQAAAAEHALRGAGFEPGCALRLGLEASPSGAGRDKLMARLVAGGLDGAAVQLQSVVYKAALGGGLGLLASPLRAFTRDALPQLNPSPGTGLTRLMRDGGPLNQVAAGPGVAATWRIKELSLTVARFLSPSEGALGPQPAQCLTLSQLTFSPGSRFSAALLGAQAPPLASRSFVCATATVALSGSLLASAWASIQSSAELVGGEESAISRAVGAPPLRRSLGGGAMHWGVKLASTPDAAGNCWAATVGQLPLAMAPGRAGLGDAVTMGTLLHGAGVGGSEGAAPLVAEASMQLKLRDGLTVSPGIVTVSSETVTALALGVQSRLAF